MHKIAFFIDGGYFIRRVRFFHRKYFPHLELKPEHVVTIIYHLVKKHKEALRRGELYRIFYYDAPPLDKQLRFPLPAPGHRTPGTKNCKLDIDVVLDPLWGRVDADLQTHIDGKQSFDVVGQLRHIFQHEPEPRPNWWNS